MKIIAADARPTQLAPDAYFIGRVWQDPVIQAPEPARIHALKVTFEPGARTAWHTHPLGQTLHVLSGVGVVCLRGEKPKTIQSGDTVWIPPGVEHWHGARPDTMMCHLAMQEALDGSAANWLEHVTDAEYEG